jgi:hypothetical protein
MTSMLQRPEQHARSGINYERLYEYRMRRVDPSKRRAIWREIANHLYREMGSPACVLDPAAGHGEFISAIPAEERWAVDIVAHAQNYGPGVRTVISDIFDAELPDNHFDGIFVSNFLEHLATQDSVADFLDRMFKCASPGGVITILGPNFKYCGAEYFDCADHVLALTHVSVAEHLYAAGFVPRAVYPRFLPFSFRGVLPASPTLTRAYLQTPLAWKVLGKQYLLHAGRP